MAFSLTTLMDSPPTLLLDLSDPLGYDQFQAHIVEIERLIIEHGWQNRLVYLMIDATNARISFTQVLQLFSVHASNRGKRGAASDPLLLACFVGTTTIDPLLRLASQFLTKASSVRPMLIVPTRDEAVNFFTQHAQSFSSTPN